MILKYIRFSYLHRLILPSLLLLTVFWISSFLPWKDYLFPRTLDARIPIGEQTAAASGEEKRFYQISPGQLYYTGCDAMSGSRISGHYYYALDGRFCQLYLLPASGRNPEPVVSPGVLRGTLDDEREPVYEIADAMSVSLDWSQRRILEITDSPVFNAVPAASPLNRLLYLLVPFCILAGAAGFLHCLFYVLFPACHPALRRLRRESGGRNILSELEEELSGRLLKQAYSLFLTEHYLINLQEGHILFQPLEDVCWIYIHTSFTGLPRRYYKGKFYFTWWTRSGKSQEVSLPGKDDGVDIMEAVQERYPAVLIRFTRENKNAAEKIMKKKIFHV